MIIKKIGIPSIMPDNDIQYLNHIMRCISIIDDDSELVISKTINGYNWTLRHSDESLKALLVRQITAAHEVLGLEATFSSFKTSPFITFRLNTVSGVAR